MEDIIGTIIWRLIDELNEKQDELTAGKLEIALEIHNEIFRKTVI